MPSSPILPGPLSRFQILSVGVLRQVVSARKSVCACGFLVGPHSRSLLAELAEVISIILAPFVTDETRNEWERYSVENQGWFQEGLDVSNGNKRDLQVDNNFAIPEEIYRVDGLSAARERGPGPYLPQWQIAPIVPVPALVNFNLLSHTGYQDSLNALLEAQVAVVGRSFDFSDPNDEATAGRRDVFNFFLENWEEDNVFEDDPIADLHVPLYDDFDENNRQLVGLLTCVVHWRTYFVNILPESTNGITVVLANTCDQEYTYQIHGVNVEYTGPGDLHDTAFDEYEMGTEEGAYLQGDKEKRNIDGSCLYSIRVYPSQEFENGFITNDPAVYTSVLVFIFLFTSAVFLFYDCLVERRQRVVMDTAVASSAIVSSLFPKVVRDRLYQKDKPKDKPKTKSKGKESAPGIEELTQQNRLQNFVSEIESIDETPSNAMGKPIADLFEDCTVFFADIAGFTAWSSEREPSDVFGLLETLYGTFDKIAKKRRVFKVETIGDCYLAVTGLPEPQQDHVVIMCTFAHECRRKMTLLLENELSTMFGNDTGNLSMRFGLHSGPVTAGVLRGEKSRFQLFGDTVNTAARMESTGMRDKIQISQESADLLVGAGKGGWLSERADMIQAKGKGLLQTYWLQIKSGNMSAPSRRTVSSDDTTTVQCSPAQDLLDQSSKHARMSYFQSSLSNSADDSDDSFGEEEVGTKPSIHETSITE
jgi:class 3 adenylate cyclase